MKSWALVGALALIVSAHLAAASQPWGFQSVTEQAGISFKAISGTLEKEFLVETMGGGICILDYDADGWPDLFLVNGTDRDHWNRGRGPTDRLYRNLRNGTFEDVTVPAGVQDSQWGMGCVAADYDGDGHTDLYVANFGDNVLYRNQGNGTFVDSTIASGTGDPGWSTGVAFGDYDGDGDLDLYLANYVDFDFENPGGDARFCSYRGVPVACGPRGLKPGHDRLFQNQGRGHFSDVTRAAGIVPQAHGYGFQPVWTDFDQDGDLDIFVANDSTPNFLWENRGDGTFIESALMTGLAYNQEGRPQANMGVAVGDYDGNGQLDIYSTNFSDDYHVLYQNLLGNYLQDSTFQAKIAQVTFPFLGFGTQMADFNNDGRPDLFAANGHIYPQVDQEGLGSSYRQRNQLFVNLGEGEFEEWGAQLGPGLALSKCSRGSAWLDYDRDGDLDLIVSNLDDTADLLRNDLAPSGFLQLQLRGRGPNLEGIGARVRLQIGRQSQLQELHAGSSFLGNNQTMLHFGLGTATSVDRLEIVWPTGHRQSFTQVAGNRRWLVDEKTGLQPLP